MVKIVLFLLSAAVAIVVCIQEQVFLAAAVVCLLAVVQAQM
jgi:hypothetical protein